MTTSARQIRGVLFDMDGVLYESEPFLVQAAIQMFAERGVTVAASDFDPYFGMGEDHLLAGVARQHGVALPVEVAKQRTYALYFDAIHGVIQPLPGVHAFIHRCVESRLRTALATSGDRIKASYGLQEIHLSESTFGAVVTGSDIVRKKPAPDIFLEAARRLGLAASSCLVIEDAIAGVQAAKAAGAHCLAVTTNNPADKLREAGADWVVPDLAHAPDECMAW